MSRTAAEFLATCFYAVLFVAVLTVVLGGLAWLITP